MTTPLSPFTQPWADAFRVAINASERYRAAAGGWTWPLALTLDPAPAAGFPDGAAVVLDLHRGECRDATAVAPAAEGRAPFVVRGDYDAWKAVIRRQLDPVAGIMTGRLRLEGSLATLMMHTRSARELVDCAAAVPTAFPGEDAAAAGP